MLSTLSGIVFWTSFIPYIYAILRKGAKPAKASWLVWVTVDTMMLVGMWKKNADIGQVLGATIGGWIVVLLAFKYGVPGWKKMDIACMVSAGIGIALWMWSDDATVGITIAAAICCIGSIPTFLSAWREPWLESRTAWTLMCVSCMMTITVIPRWTLADTAQPLAYTAIESIMMFLLWRPRRSPV